MTPTEAGFSTRRRRLRMPALGLIGIALAGLYHPSFALGLDEAEVTGRIGQPLGVSVPIRVSAEEARYVEARLVRLKSPTESEYDAATLARGFRTQVVADRHGRMVVEVTSRSRIMEPYLEFTVEISSRNTRVQRDFTVFVDLPGAEVPQASPSTLVASAPEVIEPIAAAAPPGVIAYAPPGAIIHASATTRQPGRAPRPAPHADPVAIAGNESGAHVVRRGDSLYSIARAFAHAHGLTVAEAVKRLYRGNPGAFRGSPDMMLAGARLSLDALDDSAGMLAGVPVQTLHPAAVVAAAAIGAFAPIAAAEVSAVPAPAVGPAALPVPATTARDATALARPPLPRPATPPSAVAGEPLVNLSMMGAAEAAPSPGNFGIDTLKLDDHLAVKPIAAGHARVLPAQDAALPIGVIVSSFAAAAFTAVLWFMGMGFLRRRARVRPRTPARVR